MDEYFTKPYKLLLNIARAVGFELGKFLHKKKYIVRILEAIVSDDKINILIDIIVGTKAYESKEEAGKFFIEKYRGVEPFYVDKLKWYFNLNRQFIGTHGTYLIFNPRIFSISFKIKDRIYEGGERMVGVNLRLTLDYRLVKHISIKSFNQSEAVQFIFHEYPELYKVLEDREFITNFSYTRIAEELNIIKDEFKFHLLNSNIGLIDWFKFREKLDYLDIMSSDVATLLIKAHFFNVYPYLYSKIKKLNNDWISYLLKFYKLLYDIREGEHRYRLIDLNELLKFIISGSLGSRLYQSILYFYKRVKECAIFQEIAHSIIETNSPLMTNQDEEFFLQYLKGSSLYKNKNLIVP